MMAFGGIGFLEMLLVVLMGGGLNLPVGLPPMADDPKMSQVAPEQALIYMSWAGTAQANANSGNATEKLLAEPQVKFMLKKIEDGILGAVNHEARNDEDAKVLIKHGHLLLKQMLLRPTTIYLSKFDPVAEAPTVEAGLVVNFGKDAAAAKVALEAFESIIVKELGADVQVMPANEGGLRRLPLPEGEAALVAWGFEGEYLMIAVGKETAGRLRSALTNGKAPAWLTDVKKRLALPRHSSLTYINTAALLKQFGPMLGSQMMGGPEGRAQFDRIISVLGLDKMNYVASVTGFDETKFVTRSFIATAPDAKGLFDLIPKAGLTAADLRDVPRDADLALILKANPATIFDQIVAIIGAIEPREKEGMMRDMQEAETELGFRVKEDMLASIGDVFSIYNSPSDGGLLFTGLTGVAAVKDHAKAQKVITQLERLFDAEFNRNRREDPNAWRRRRYEIKTLEVGEHKVRYINAVGDDWGVSPAWCLTKDRFIIAPYPQMVRSFLERAAKPQAGTFAQIPQVQELFGKGAAPASMMYLDTPELFKKVYPLAHPMMSLLCSEMQREGFDIDITALPTASAIQPHLTPDTSTMARVSDGLISESRSTLPLAGISSGLPLMAATWMMSARSMQYDTAPANTAPHEHDEEGHAQPVRPVQPRPLIETTAAKRTKAMNDLRQIGIALFVYHSEKNSSAPSLDDLKPYLGKVIKEDPWGQSYLYFGKNLTPAGANAAETPFAATSHLIDGRRTVLYGDGHVEAIEEKQFKKQMEVKKLDYPAPVELKAADDRKAKDNSKDAPKSSEKVPAIRPRTQTEKE